MHTKLEPRNIMIHLAVILNCVPSRKIIPVKESFDPRMEVLEPQTGYKYT